ncbi:MAG: NADPH-dependent F420 reductase [Acidobacteriota bacterium]
MADEKVGLIGGTGEEGQGIALRLAMAGVPVWIGSRSEERAEKVAGELNRRLGSHGAGNAEIGGMGNRALLDHCRLLFLTVPFDHAESTLESLQDAFRDGHVLVDVTVPLLFLKGPRLLDLEEGSGAEQLRRLVPEHVAMAAAFKTLPAHLLCEIDQPLDCDEVLCADSEKARQRVLAVVGKIDRLRWINAGPLRYCQALEAMTMLVVGINRRYKIGSGRFRLVGLE